MIWLSAYCAGAWLFATIMLTLMLKYPQNLIKYGFGSVLFIVILVTSAWPLAALLTLGMYVRTGTLNLRDRFGA